MRNISIKTKEILLFILLILACYALIILVFAYFYYITGSIGMTEYGNSLTDPVDFRKAIYFSIVSFHTIGFGDIHPVTDQGRFIVMIQSSISLFFTAIFSGLLIYIIIKRPRDIFVTKKVYIRHRNGKFWLSMRLGNKGRAIIEITSRFEAWKIENNNRVRIFQLEKEMPDLERILYFDIPLDEPESRNLLDAIRTVLKTDQLLHMKLSFIGNDIRSGEQVAHARYYDSGDLRFGTMFLNVYSWSVKGRRKDYHWKNFERIGAMEPEMEKAFLEKESVETM
jgi:hypothetical protein